MIERAARIASWRAYLAGTMANGIDGENTLRVDKWASANDRGSDRTFGIQAAKGRSA